MRPIIETINSIIGGQSGSPQYQELIKKAYQDPEVQSFLRQHRAELSDDFGAASFHGRTHKVLTRPA